jgi:hypothetical protein
MEGAIREPGRPDPHGYAAAADRHAAECARFGRQSKRLSWARLAVFLGATAILLSAFPGPTPHLAARLAAAAAGFLGFGGLVYWHSRIEARERWFSTLVRLNREASARVARDWSGLSPVDVDPPPADHPFAADLDLVGHASLIQLLGSIATEPGRKTLLGWLSAPAPPSIVRRRQAAVAELAALRREREEFAALGRLVEPERAALDGLLDWAEHGPWFIRARWRVATVISVNAAFVALVVAHAAGFTDRPNWIYALVAAAGVMALFGKRTHQIFTRVFARAGALEHHAGLFRRISDTRFASPLLVSLQAELRATGAAAADEISALARIGQFADVRRVAVFYPVVALLTLWDYHVLVALERWQLRTASHLRRWYGALGEFDALAALAALAHDNPAWSFPEILDSAHALDASLLGHPLIPDDRRVANDVHVGPPGSFVMVTGSNMSGKSTLLRAVGANVVLAQAGGPVCAARLSMPPLSLATSMRVQDSLEEGVSYFMAAVRRLALVVDEARRASPNGPLLLYLLDEVLQGTNTAERQVAVRRILKHLLALRVIGLVTTHDLELAACDELAGACRSVHFTEGVEHLEGGLRLTFDYELKPGLATSRNALTLLKIVGLDP